jgi:putative PIN family toxin of toxin-antitoxin system
VTVRVVADTNILISALMFGGLPGSFLDLALMNAFTLVTSPALLDELDEKLRAKFGVSKEDAEAIRRKLEGVASIVQPAIVLKLIVEDPDDNRVLECAEEGKADTIVSGDRHLLRLESFGNTPIVRVREFLNAFSVGETKCL